MPEIHLRQPRFTYSPYGPFTKNKKTIQKFKEMGDSKYIYQNKLDKTCIQHDVVQGGFKCSPRKTASDQILPDKAFNISKTLRHDVYQCRPSPMVYNFFDKRSAATGAETRINSKYENLTISVRIIQTNY